MSQFFLPAIKPSYLFAPATLFRRLWIQLFRPDSIRQAVLLPWGTRLEVNIHDTIGGAIFRQGVFDIGVSECAWRLLKPGDHVLDAGANIGYMTSLFAAKVGKQGMVHSFEPHPKVRLDLQANVARIAQKATSAPIVIHEYALGAVNESADLVESDHFSNNQGTACLAEVASTSTAVARHRVEVRTLDELFPTEEFGLLKIDVEGHEAKLIEGAQRLLSEHRIRNLIYEDHSQGHTVIPESLTAKGYKIFSIGHTLFGLHLKDFRNGIRLDTSWESPSYLATVDPNYVTSHIRRGWQIFKGV